VSDGERHPAWSFWWPALVAFSTIPIVLLATGAVGFRELLGVIFVLLLVAVAMVGIMVAIVIPLWRSALRDVARWTKPPDD
jgi:hypothetical protein